MRAEHIDVNLRVSSALNQKGLVFFDAQKAPFKVYGLQQEQDLGFVRMPSFVATQVSEGVAHLNRCTAGGRLRFATDSDYVAINAEMNTLSLLPHMAFAGSAGFDLYVQSKGRKPVFYSAFLPPIGIKDGYESIIHFANKKMRDITINFPLYSGVTKLYVGLDERSKLLPSSEYALMRPLVFYGSSITQGGCASRPGNSYPSIISRKLNCDYINLGFSGNAKAESSISQYIAGLDMSLFVYDYDHNAPNTQHLQSTHYTLYQNFRKEQPHTPVIMLSRPDFDKNKADSAIRRDIIRHSYTKGIDSGDKNLYFIDGQALFGSSDRDDCTVDGTHPNDLGFYKMAQKILPVCKAALSKRL